MSKGYFPYLLNDLNYNGPLPEYNLFTDITPSIYSALAKEFSNKLWNFKKEAIKYCIQDCVSLHQILTKFNNLIFNKFKIDHKKVLTAPALAMRIWKTFYMPKDSVYQINDVPEAYIRKSYTGGAVDLYIPKNINNETLYCYDVNGLYPSVMLNNPMPIGKPIAFEGDIIKYNPNAFGFFNCKITSPDYLEHPIIQRKVKTTQGPRTIAGLGSWEGWLFSEEMYNAMKFGYKFEVIKGYEFKKGDIGFNSYIQNMYNLRLQYPKGDPMNITAKLLSTSLYGKFGMSNETTKVIILNNNLLDTKGNNILDKFNNNIKDIIKLENHTVLFINDKKNILEDNFTNSTLKTEDLYHSLDVNVAIASAITAYARIHMSQFKNNPNFRLYYSDTDSIIIDSLLPNEMIGTNLGQMKLEYTIKNAIFLAPKVYALIDENGNEIIKAKGLTRNTISGISFNDFEQLLIKDSFKIFEQDKAKKDLYKSEFTILKTIYTLFLKG